MLTYLSRVHAIDQLRVVTLREGSDASRTAVLRLKTADASSSAKEGRPGIVGWEKNDKGRLGPRMADLAPLMDPTK